MGGAVVSEWAGWVVVKGGGMRGAMGVGGLLHRWAGAVTLLLHSSCVGGACWVVLWAKSRSAASRVSVALVEWESIWVRRRRGGSWSVSCPKSRSAASRISAVARMYELICV